MKNRALMFVIAGHEGYGIRSVWRLLEGSLRRRGFKLTIAVLNHHYYNSWRLEFPESEVIFGPPIFGISQKQTSYMRSLIQVGLSGWLYRLGRDRDVDAIVVQGPLDTFICGIVARTSGIPALWFMPNAVSNDYFYDINKRIYRILFRFANVVPIANSEYTNLTLGGGFDRRHVVHLAVDTNFFRPSGGSLDRRRELNIAETEVIIGLFARMTPLKGQYRLIEALSELPDHLHVLFCGGPLESDYHRSLTELAKAHGMEHRLHFFGFVEDLRSFYAACDFIVNMRIDPEPFGLSIIEAMASGKPVLAHALGGPAETIIDGETGWLIPDCSVSSITEGLRRALNDFQRWPFKQDAARAHAISKFSLQRFDESVYSIVCSEIERFEGAR